MSDRVVRRRVRVVVEWAAIVIMYGGLLAFAIMGLGVIYASTSRGADCQRMLDVIPSPDQIVWHERFSTALASALGTPGRATEAAVKWGGVVAMKSSDPFDQRKMQTRSGLAIAVAPDGCVVARGDVYENLWEWAKKSVGLSDVRAEAPSGSGDKPDWDRRVNGGT